MTGARSQIRQVITDLGTEVFFIPITVSINSYGDKTETEGVGVSVQAIPAEYFKGRYNYQPVGNINEGDVILIIRDDETLDIRDGSTIYTIELDDSIYQVDSIEDFDIANITLAKQVILKKRLYG